MTDTPSQERDDITDVLALAAASAISDEESCDDDAYLTVMDAERALKEITRLRKELKTVKAASRELIDALTAEGKAKLRLDELKEARADGDTLHAADEKYSDVIVDVMEAIVRVRAALGEGQ